MYLHPSLYPLSSLIPKFSLHCHLTTMNTMFSVPHLQPFMFSPSSLSPRDSLNTRTSNHCPLTHRRYYLAHLTSTDRLGLMASLIFTLSTYSMSQFSMRVNLAPITRQLVIMACLLLGQIVGLSLGCLVRFS